MATCLPDPTSAALARAVPFLEGIVHFFDRKAGALPLGKQPTEPAEKPAPPEAPKFGCDRGFPPLFDSAFEYRGVERALRPRIEALQNGHVVEQGNDANILLSPRLHAVELQGLLAPATLHDRIFRAQQEGSRQQRLAIRAAEQVVGPHESGRGKTDKSPQPACRHRLQSYEAIALSADHDAS